MQDISVTIDKAKHGDQEALSSLYRENYKIVFFAVRSVVRDEDEAMDILQDTFVRAFHSLDQLKDSEKFAPWIKQIAVNNALQSVKKKKPILFSQMQSDENDSDWNVEDRFLQESREGLPDVEIDRKETERLIGEILDTLPEDQRIVINLFYFEQMSAKEIADKIGVSVTLVNTRLSLGRKRVEKKVLELEKRGTKLYGLAPIPFLLLLFRNVEAQAASVRPSQAVLQLILNSLETSPVSGAAASAASGMKGALTGAKAAGAGASKTALGAGIKAAVSVCSAALVLAGAYGIFNHFRTAEDDTPIPEKILVYDGGGNLESVREYDQEGPGPDDKGIFGSGRYPEKVYANTENGLILSEINEYEMAQDGSVVKRNHYNCEESASDEVLEELNVVQEYEYDEELRCTKITSYQYDSAADRLVLDYMEEKVYDDENHIATVYYHSYENEEATYSESVEYLCDSQWKQQEMFRYQDDGDLYRYGKYEYSDDGKSSLYTEYEADGAIRSTWEEKYDERGYLSEEIISYYNYKGGEVSDVDRTVIKYYYPGDSVPDGV